jgi:hypothetical protein
MFFLLSGSEDGHTQKREASAGTNSLCFFLFPPSAWYDLIFILYSFSSAALRDGRTQIFFSRFLQGELIRQFFFLFLLSARIFPACQLVRIKGKNILPWESPREVAAALLEFSSNSVALQ